MINNYIANLKQALDGIDAAKIERVVDLIRHTTIRKDCIVWLIGNGGSASTASHIACDLQKGLSSPTMHCSAISLVDSIPILTAYANDVGYEAVFSKQIQSLMRFGDLLLAFSVSGNSENVIQAVEAAHKKVAGMIVPDSNVVGFTGRDGGQLAKAADVCIQVQSDDMQIVEDVHLAIGHIIYRALIA